MVKATGRVASPPRASAGKPPFRGRSHPGTKLSQAESRVRSGSVRLLAGAIVFFLICMVGGASRAVESVQPAGNAAAADTTRTVSGLSGMVVDLYNYDLVWYGLAVVAVMVVMGVVIGYAMDFLVTRIGIDLGKLEHRE